MAAAKYEVIKNARLGAEDMITIIMSKEITVGCFLNKRSVKSRNRVMDRVGNKGIPLYSWFGKGSGKNQFRPS